MKKPRLLVTALALSASGLLAIAGFEGFSLNAYIPTIGDVPTIGFGSTSGVKLGDKIDVSTALERLESDTKRAQRGVASCVNVPLTQNEFDVFTSFAFNVGNTNFCTSTLVKKLNQLDYDGACKELLRWDKKTYYVNGVRHVTTLPGLTKRRQKEYEKCMQR